MAIITAQCPVDLSQYLVCSNMCMGITGKIVVSLFIIKMILTSTLFFNSEQDETLPNQASTPTQPSFLTLAPSTYLKTSAAWTSTLDSSGKLFFSFKCFFFDCCSRFWIMSLQNIMSILFLAAFFNIVIYSTDF